MHHTKKAALPVSRLVRLPPRSRLTYHGKYIYGQLFIERPLYTINVVQKQCFDYFNRVYYPRGLNELKIILIGGPLFIIIKYHRHRCTGRHKNPDNYPSESSGEV